jgi:hypothetical protein
MLRVPKSDVNQLLKLYNHKKFSVFSTDIFLLNYKVTEIPLYE